MNISKGLMATEAECAAGRTAPRVSLQDIQDAVSAVLFKTGEELAPSAWSGKELDAVRGLTVAIVVLANGWTVIGKSAPVSLENFDADLGQKLAYEDAVNQVWPLMGFALKQQLQLPKRDGELVTEGALGGAGAET